MRRLDNILSYLLADPRFYDELGNADFPYDLEKMVRDIAGADDDVLVRGVWAICRPASVPPLPEHGWKIHVSTVPAAAKAALEIVGREFARQPFHFKSLRDEQIVVSATSRWWPTGQVGKVIAIYPHTADDCRDLLERLHPALADIAGPYILTDRRYRDSRCLYYRYGEFVSSGRTEPDGSRTPVLTGPDGQEWTDDRLPLYRRPPWIPELLPPEPAIAPEPGTAPEGGDKRMLNGYRVTRALHHTGAGGVYLAERVSDGTTVVLKEARPNTGFAYDGSDSQQRLRREFGALTLLKDTGVAPQPYELFEAWEHLFLAQEYLQAHPLTRYLAARNPLSNGQLDPEGLATYRTEVDTVIAGLRAAVGACHERGIAFGDLSLTNVFVDPDSLRVWLIDFESSRPLENWDTNLPATIGFTPADGSAMLLDGRAFDEFGVASIELATIFPRNMLRALNPPALARTTVHAAAVLDRPVEDLLTRLELPAQPPPVAEDLPALVRGATRFIEGVMSVDRDDRVFPADPTVFVTNPWSVSYGAAGVMRALHRLTGQLPPALAQWRERMAGELDRLPAGLYLGLSGVAWTLLDIGELDSGRDLLDRALRTDHSGLPADLATGSAGVGTACLAGWLRTGDDGYRQRAAQIGDHLIGTATDPGTGLHWPGPDKGKPVNGLAYGASGVAQFLLYLHRATGEQRFLRAGRRALNFELDQLTPRADGGIWLPGRVESTTFEPYWERGAAGFGGALARYCVVTGDAALRQTLDRLVRSIVSGTAINPGLFLGMAGIVNFALDCHHLLGEPDHHRLATEMAEGIIALACEEPEGVAFPGLGLLRYTTDFASGGAGIALVLDRLANGGPDFNYTLDELLVDRPASGSTVDRQLVGAGVGPDA